MSIIVYFIGLDITKLIRGKDREDLTEYLEKNLNNWGIGYIADRHFLFWKLTYQMINTTGKSFANDDISALTIRTSLSGVDLPIELHKFFRKRECDMHAIDIILRVI